MNISKKWSILAFLVLFIGFLHTNPILNLNDPIPFDPDVVYGQLDNGLTYYIRQNSMPANMARLSLVLKVGSLYEDDDQLGLAHFVEHMGFNGTAAFPGNALEEYLSSIGMGFDGGLSGLTHLDYTVYQLNSRTDNAEQLDKSILILSEWAARMSFDPHEIDDERGVIIEEMRSMRGAGDRLRREIFQVAYAGSPYADRMPIGTQEILESFPHKRLLDFYDDWYRPDLLAVIAVGDFEVDNVKNLISKHFDSIPKRQNPRPLPTITIPEHAETRVSLVKDPEQTNTTINISHKHVFKPYTDVAVFRDQLKSQLLTSILGTRFTEISRQENPPFISASSAYVVTIKPLQEFRLNATIDENKIMEGITAIITELERAKQHGFYYSELQRAKDALIKSFENDLLEKNTTHQNELTWNYFNHFVYRVPLLGVENFYNLSKAIIESITLADVYASLIKLATEQNRVIILSSTANVELPAESEILALFPKIQAQTLEKFPEKATNITLLETLPKRVKVNKPKFDKQLELYTWTLKNGATVHLKTTDFKNNEILLKVSRAGGTMMADDNAFTSARFANPITSQSGLADFDRNQLDNYLSDKTVRLFTNLYRRYDDISGNCSVADFQTMMQLLYLNFTAHRFDEQAFATWKNRTEVSLRNRDNKPETVFYDIVTKFKFDDHLRFRPQTMDDLSKVDHKTAFDFHKSRFDSANGFHFIFVGNIDKDELHKYIEQYIATLPNRKAKVGYIDRGVRLSKKPARKELRMGRDEKTIVSLQFTSDYQVSETNFFKVHATNDVLSRMLFENVREKLSGVYYIHSDLMIIQDGTGAISWTIDFGCSPDRVEELITASLNEIQKIVNDDFDDKFLDAFKEAHKKHFPNLMRINEFLIGALETILVSNERTVNGILNSTTMVDNISKNDVVETVKKHFDHETLKVMVLIPEKP